jgi:pimeloyl-ACP methyl ester carboxylesterase
LSFITALGWNKEQFSIIGHSYGAHLALAVKFFSMTIVCSFIL